jgi:dTDP-4-dehydrorhamnose reductase
VRFEHDPEGREAKRIVDEVIDPGPVRPSSPPVVLPSRPILVTGRTGTLGQVFTRVCERRGLPYVATDRTRLRLEKIETIRETLDREEPYAVVNAAGFASLNDAEALPERCWEANALGAENLARACKERGIPLITFSSDMVFDGTKGEPYVETDEPRPMNVYGRSKAEGERRVMTVGGRILIVRSATFFSPYESNNFAVRLLNDLSEGQRPAFAEDRFMSPTYVPDLVDAVLDLLIDGETGIRHLSNSGRVSWAGFARMIAETAGYDPSLVRAVPADTLGWRAEYGADLALGSASGVLLSEIDPAVGRFLADTRHGPVKRRPHPNADERDPMMTVASA